jgi:hypothetical protein
LKTYSLLLTFSSAAGVLERKIAEIAKANAPANQRKPTNIPLLASPVNDIKESNNKIKETVQHSTFEYLAKTVSRVSMTSLAVGYRF